MKATRASGQQERSAPTKTPGTPTQTRTRDFSDDPRLWKLLALHALELLPKHVIARLDELFRHPVRADVLERLERAADYLGITEEDAAELVDQACERRCST